VSFFANRPEHAPAGLVLFGWLYAFELGNLLEQSTLNGVSQGDLGHGATFTGSLQAHFGDAFVCYLNEFYVTAVSLKKRSDLVKSGFDFIEHGKSSVCYARSSTFFKQPCQTREYSFYVFYGMLVFVSV